MVGGMFSMLLYGTGICCCIYIKKMFIASVHSFFILFKNLVLIYRRNGPRYQLVLALCAFFLTRVILKGLILQKNWCMFVYVLFYVNLCQD